MPERLVPGSPGYVRERSEEIDRAELELNGTSVPILDGSPRGRGRDTRKKAKPDAKPARKKRRKTPRKRPAIKESEDLADPSPVPVVVSESRRKPLERVAVTPPIAAAPHPLVPPRPPQISVSSIVSGPPRSHRDSEISIPLLEPSDTSSDDNYNNTGNCRNISKREKLLLLILIVIALLCVIIPMVVTGVDESKDNTLPVADPAASVRFGVISFKTTTVSNVAILPKDITSQLVSRSGFKIVITITGGTFTPSQMLSFSSNIPSTKEPQGLEEHFKSTTFTSSSVSPTEIVVQIGPNEKFKTFTMETLSVVINSHLAVGHPLFVNIVAEVPQLPQESLRDGSSKAYAASSIISAAAAVGGAASAGSLPKLMLITSAFECPTEDYFEIEWTYHPLLLVKFPDIVWDYSGSAIPEKLKTHVSAIVGNTLLMISSVLLLLSATVALVGFRSPSGWFHSPKSLNIRRTNFDAAASSIGFPHYLVIPLMFLSPGISVACGSLIYYHPSAGAKMFGVIMLGCTCIAPGAAMFGWIRSNRFNAEYVKFDEENAIFRFLLGTHEWTSKDETLFYRTKLFYEDYKPAAKWFLVFELSVGIMFGLIEAYQPKDLSGCRWRSWGLLLVNTIYCLLATFVRPMHVLVETFFMIPMAYCNELILILIVINHHSEDKKHWSADVAGVLSTVALYLAMGKILVDIIIFISEVYVDRRNQKAEGEGSQNTIDDDKSRSLMNLPLQVDTPKYKMMTISYPDERKGRIVTHSLQIRVDNTTQNNSFS